MAISSSLNDAEDRDFVEIPCLSSSTAGYGVITEKDIERFISTSRSSLHSLEPSRFFWLRMNDQSMEKAGINSGDAALICRMNNLKNGICRGDIVAFQIEGKVTLRTLGEDNGEYIILHSENPNFEDIHVRYRDLYNDDVQFIGKMVQHLAKNNIE